MTRNEFFKELRQSITNVPADALEEILSDLNEHFDAGLEDGLQENEVCKNLGQPGSIAEEIMEEFKRSKTESNPEHPLVFVFGGHANQGSRSGQGSWHQSAYVNDADYISIDQTFANVNEVYVDMKVSDIYFERENRSDFRVVVNGKSKKSKYSIDNINGRLEVIEHESFFRFFSFSRKRTLETTIYVPSQFTGSITAKSAVGKIRTKDLTSPIKLSTSAGSVYVEKHLSETADLDSAAGSITADFLGKTALRACTGAGSIKLRANETSELLLDSGAGSVKAEINKLSGNSKLSSGAGSIKLTAYEVAGDIKLSSGAGSIKAFLPEDANIKLKLAKSSMGSVKSEINGNNSSPYTLRAQTGMGSVRILRL